MKKKFFIPLFVTNLVALVLLIYMPLLRGSSVTKAPREAKLLASAQARQENQLSFCSDVWPPYVHAPGTGKSGYVTDLLKAIYEPIGFRVNVVTMPWSLCLEEVSEGSISGLIGADQTEAPGLTFPRETMGAYRPMFYTLPTAQWTYQGIDSLKEIRLGVVQDYSYSDELDAYLARQQKGPAVLLVKGEAPLNTLLRALQEGRIDAFIENQTTIDALSETLRKGGLNLNPAGILPTDQAMFIAFNPDENNRSSLAKYYDHRLRILRRNGTLKHLLAPYNLIDWSMTSGQSDLNSPRRQSP